MMRAWKTRLALCWLALRMPAGGLDVVHETLTFTRNYYRWRRDSGPLLPAVTSESVGVNAGIGTRAPLTLDDT